MKKGWSFVFLFAILLISFASSSEVRSEFTIAGCSITNSAGDPINLPANSCSGTGFYYCDATGKTYETLFDTKGCSLGKSSYSAGQARCCPAGYVCDSGTLVCELGGIECGQYDGEQGSCENAGCFYLSEDGSCVSSPDEYSCGIYQTPGACLQDTYNLGKQGFGTEVCSKRFTLGSNSYIVPTDSCKCSWADNKCKLQWNFTESIHSGSPSSYVCQTSFDFGTCQNGVQRISWTALGLNGLGVFLNGISQEALSAPGCVDGEIERVCGAPTIKLPGFSWLAALLIVLALMGFYVFRRN